MRRVGVSSSATPWFSGSVTTMELPTGTIRLRSQRRGRAAAGGDQYLVRSYGTGRCAGAVARAAPRIRETSKELADGQAGALRVRHAAVVLLADLRTQFGAGQLGLLVEELASASWVRARLA